jgi:lysophospholipase L1-like esterase
MIGINDLIHGVPPQIVLRRVQLIVETLRENEIVPIVQSVLFIASGDEINRQVEKLNAAIQDWCAAQGIAYVNLNATLSSGRALLPKYSGDGVHLNDEAYGLWRLSIEKLIRPYLKNH